jgi:glutathione synthase/RimK-type ligase-like ATP-grasp enzyme
MNLKWIVSTGRIQEIISKSKNVNPIRYNSFVNSFGSGNVGLIQVGDLFNEINTGKTAQIYSLEKNLQISLSKEKGVGCELLLMSGFDLERGKRIQRDNLEQILNYLEHRKSLGDIGEIVNSKKSTLFEDKISFVGLKDKGLLVPETHHFKNKDIFYEFINEMGTHVVKHRFGYEGLNNFLIDKKNLNLIRDKDISDYIVQEILDIESETRIIFYKNQFLGSRKIIDRTRPWEKKKNSGRKHILEKYNPSEEEIKWVMEFFKYTGAILGSIDTVKLSDGSERVLEFNGVATGLGCPEGPYDLNEIVAQKLKKDYF